MSRQRIRRAVAAMSGTVGVLLVGALLAVTPANAHAATADPTPAPSASGTPGASDTPTPRQEDQKKVTTMTVAAGRGGVLERGSALSASAVIGNGSDEELEGGTVEFWVDPSPITTRAALRHWQSGTTKPSGAVRLGEASTPDVTAGASTTVALHVPGPTLTFGDGHRAGVFGIGASLLVDGTRLALARGTLTLTPKDGDPEHPARVAVAMPITVPATANGLIGADDLAAFTAPDGILSREVNGVLGHPRVAIGLDPMILASIRVLGSAAPQSALDWRDRLLHLPNDIFPLRYGDADASAQAQAGLSKLLAPTSFTWAMQPANFQESVDPAGETPQSTPAGGPTTPSPTASTGVTLPTTSELLSWPYTLSGIAWPAAGSVSSSDLGTFRSSGLDSVIVSSANVSGAAAGTTPNAAFRSGSSTILTSDSALSTALRTAVAAPNDTVWNAAMGSANAQLMLLSESSAHTAQGSTAQAPTLLATLSRAWPADAARLSSTLGALGMSPRADMITLPQAKNTAATRGLKLKNSPEPDSRIDRVQSLLDAEKKIDDFATVLTKPELMTGQQRAKLLSLLGVTWRGPNNDWSDAVEQALTASAKTLSSVSIVPGGPVNVASTEAPLPVTVENKLDHAVHLVLRAEPSNGRLEIDGDATKTLQADSRGTVFVPVKATVGNGKATLSLQLYSATDVPIGESASIPIEVHAEWEGLAAAVLAVLIVGLFGFGLVRNIVRHRAKRRAIDAGDAALDDGTPHDGAAPHDAGPPSRDDRGPHDG